jgi:hypothetical protein
MHLLCVTNEVIFLIFVREQFLAPVQEPGQETNGISKEIICIIYIRCIMYIICIICRVQQNKNKIQPTFSQVRSAALYHLEVIPRQEQNDNFHHHRRRI